MMTSLNKTRKIFAIILALILLNSSFFPSFTFAYNEFFSGNDILFYDEDAEPFQNPENCVSEGSISYKVWNYFIGKGLTKEQTAGIMGNMYQESHISPTTWQSVTADMFSTEYEGGWGIFGWSGTNRYDIKTTTKNGQTTTVESGILGVIKTTRPEFLKYVDPYYNAWGSEIDVTKGVLLDGNGELEEKNIPKSDLDNLVLFELDYMWDEFEFDSFLGYDQLKAATTAREAAIVFHKTYERSGDSEKIIQQRADWAEIIYNTLKDKPVGNFDSTNCSSNELVNYILKYAWPKFIGYRKEIGQIATTPTEAYRAAIDIANAEGRYTGDTCYGGGIDCGAFITTLVYDSGYDKEYNYGSFTSKGASYTGDQINWLRNNWQQLTISDSSQLQLGDIAIFNNGSKGHVFMFIGSGTIEGIDEKYDGVSAAQCSRAPMVTDYEVASAIGSNNELGYTWYRKK